MSSDYQPKKENPYLLPRNLYWMVKYAIRDYDRLKKRYEDMLSESSAPPDGMPKSNKISDPTGDKAIKREVLFRQLESIEQALLKVPPEYREGVFTEAKYGGGFPLDAGVATYKRWKQRFIYWAAENINLV